MTLSGPYLRLEHSDPTKWGSTPRWPAWPSASIGGVSKSFSQRGDDFRREFFHIFPPDQVEVKEAELAVEKAERAVKEAKNENEREMEKAERAVEKAQSEIEKAERAVEKAQFEIEKAERAVEVAERCVGDVKNEMEREKEKAERAVERAERAVERAELAVETAELELKKVDLSEEVIVEQKRVTVQKKRIALQEKEAVLLQKEEALKEMPTVQKAKALQEKEAVVQQKKEALNEARAVLLQKKEALQEKQAVLKQKEEATKALDEIPTVQKATKALDEIPTVQQALQEKEAVLQQKKEALKEKLAKAEMRLSDPQCVWTRSPASDITASSFKKLGLSFRERCKGHRAATPSVEDTFAEEDNIRYLGDDVYALRPEGASMEEDADSNRSGPDIILRLTGLPVAKRALDRVRTGGSAFVVGQPGIGKTRGLLSYALMELLADGAAVVRLNYKRNEALLFYPDEKGTYEVWCTSLQQWELSKMHNDKRLVCLVDPPEKSGNPFTGFSSAITFCSNNIRHYRNEDKDNLVVFVPLPTEKEVIAMTPILWSEKKTDPHDFVKPLRNEKPTDLLRRQKVEVLRRTRLVGVPSPRYIFDWTHFIARVSKIEAAAKPNALSISLEALNTIITHKSTINGNIPHGEDNIRDSSNLLYNISANPPLAGKETDSWIIPTLQYNDLASLSVFRHYCDLLKRGESEFGWKFERLAILAMRQAITWTVYKPDTNVKGDKKSFRTGTFHEVKYTYRECLNEKTIEDTTARLESLKEEDNKVLVPDVTNYPGLDCAFGRLHWLQMKVGFSDYKLKCIPLSKLLKAINIQDNEAVTLTIVHNNSNTPGCYYDLQEPPAGLEPTDLQWKLSPTQLKQLKQTGQLKPTSSQLKLLGLTSTQLEGLEKTPVYLKLTPEQLESTLEQLESTPEQLESNPAFLKITPEQVKQLNETYEVEEHLARCKKHLKIEFLRLDQRSDCWKSKALEDYDWNPNSGTKTLPSEWKYRLAILELLRDFFMERGRMNPPKVESPAKE